ncbi:nuclear pore complex protein NUP155 [Tanacetum coccineum]|uniref:Nuclear pore complex protein NUP155 n=1 Tax=Tanacetum coccineum TaxID=301880 RepID=A0ABQ5ISG3_9ASTR
MRCEHFHFERLIFSIKAREKGHRDSGLLDLLEGKLTDLQFQIKIKEELEKIFSKVEATPGISESVPNGSDAEFLQTVKEKVKELSLDLKSITQLYNDYAVPFEFWEDFVYFLESSRNVMMSKWFEGFC